METVKDKIIENCVRGQIVNTQFKLDDSKTIIAVENRKLFPEKKISHILFIFITELGFFLIYLIILLIFFVTPQYHSAKTFTSKNSTKSFDSNYIPKIFIHLTDIHISTKLQKLLDGSLIFINSILEYKPDLFIMTGDLVDNLVGKTNSMGGQNKEDWEIYNKTVRNFLSKYPVIDIAGNHDMWAVRKPTSSSNNFLSHSFSFNRTDVQKEEDFFLRKVKMFNITFLLLNDYRFPVVRPPYGIESHITKKQLDILEGMIDDLDEGEECYILTHYAIDRGLFTKSSKGNKIQDIVSNEKVSFIFSGHEHPSNVKIIHHGSKGGVEFCTPSPYNHKKTGLITIDNDNLVYHQVYIPYYTKKPLFFLTYPVPNEQLSSHHIFNLNNFEIRVIAYVSDENIKLKIGGDIKGDLKYNMTLNNGALLYSYPVNLTDGSYKINIYDKSGYSCDIKTEFTIGQKYKGKKEKYFKKIRFFLAFYFMIIPFWIYLFIIIFPFCSDLNLGIVKSIEKYIEEDKKTNINIILLILYSIILSPFFLRLRFQANKNILKYVISIAFIYPLILPLHFSKIFDGIIGYSFFIFYVTKSKVFYEDMALLYTCIYYLGVIFPYVFFNAGKKYYTKQTVIVTIFNAIFFFVFSSFGFLVNFIGVNQSISLGYLFLTPAFFLMWIVLLIFSIIFFKYK